MLDEKNRDEKQTIGCDLRLSRQKLVNFPFNVCEQGACLKKGWFKQGWIENCHLFP